MKSNTTLVTGIWDLGRESLTEGWSRSFDHYLQKFEELIKPLQNVNLIIYGDEDLRDFVWKHRSEDNTSFCVHSKDNFSGNFFPFFDKVQEIRKSENWLSQAGWLGESTQAKMEWYNPMVMSKPFLLHNAKIHDPFKSKYFYWIDGGISNTVHPGYFYHDKVLDKLEQCINKLSLIHI